MFGYDSKLILKQLFALIGESEIEIEYLRQQLASIIEFEPYTSFKRMDSNNDGVISEPHFMVMMRQNGYRTLQLQDYQKLVQYFNISNKPKPSLNYEEFLQFILPCTNSVLRCQVT